MSEHEKDAAQWAYVGPEFGTAWEFGCCNAIVVTSSGRTTVCGWPRDADGTCGGGHPAQPPGSDLLRVGAPDDSAVGKAGE